LYKNNYNISEKNPPKKLKFLDEAHVMAKDLLSKKVLSLQNHEVYIKANTIHVAQAAL
jgi:hypothetical protein